MSERIKKNLALLELLNSVSKSQLKSILAGLSNEQVKVITELIFNVQYGTIEIPEDKSSYVRNKRFVIRQITSKEETYKTRKALILKHSILISSILKFSLPQIKRITDGE